MIAQQRFELSYYNVAVLYVSHYATRTSPLRKRERERDVLNMTKWRKELEEKREKGIERENLRFGLVSLNNGTSNFVGYLMPNSWKIFDCQYGRNRRIKILVFISFYSFFSVTHINTAPGGCDGCCTFKILCFIINCCPESIEIDIFFFFKIATDSPRLHLEV